MKLNKNAKAGLIWKKAPKNNMKIYLKMILQQMQKMIKKKKSNSESNIKNRKKFLKFTKFYYKSFVDNKVNNTKFIIFTYFL